MADLEKLTVTLEANVAAYNADLAKARDETVRQTAAMEQSFAKLGTFGQRTPQSFDKLASGMSRFGKTALDSQVETELLNASLSKTAKTTGDVSHQIGAISTQGQAAFHALRGSAEQLAAGIPVTQVLAQQLNNLTYAASGSGGLTGAMKEAIGIFGRMLTPIRLVGGGIAGLAASAVAAAISFANSQSRINLALSGIGSAAGVTVNDINRIAESVSKTSGISESEAANIATAIASTGKASAEATQQATGLAKAYSLVSGTDLPKAAQALGQALADPTKGIQALNAQLGAWSDKEVQLAKNLDASGDRAAAQKIILDGMQKSIGDAASKTTAWSHAWDAVANSASKAFTWVGKSIDKAVGLNQEDPIEELKKQQAILDQMIATRSKRSGRMTIPLNQDDLDKQIAKVTEIAKKVDDIQNKDQAKARNAESGIFGDIVRGADPSIDTLNELQDHIDRLKADIATGVGAATSLTPAQQESALSFYQTQKNLLVEYNNLAKQRFGIENAILGQTARQNAIELQGINARTPAEKAEIAYLQARQQALDSKSAKTLGEANDFGELARAKSLAQSYHELSEAQRDRAYQSGQDIEQGELENSLIGRSIDVSTRLTAQFQALAAAKQEAFKNGTTVSLAEQVRAMADADQKARDALNGAKDRALESNSFDTDQIFRTSTEQDVYSQLRSFGLLDNGKIVSQQAQLVAQQIRLKDALQQTADVERGFASDFLHDLIQGKSAAKALGDALSNVANKLVDMGLDNLIGSAGNKSLLTSLLGGGGDVGLGSWAATVIPGLAGGGHVSGPGSSISDSIPAMLSDGEFVVNADATKKHRALLEAINTGKVGKFAAGGSVGMPAMRMPNISLPSVAPSSSNTPQIIFNAPLINAPNATPAAVDKMNQTSIPALKILIRSEVAQAMTRSSKIKNIIRKG